MCDKSVSTYHPTMKFVPKCFMAQEMCDKAVNRCLFVFDFIPNQHKTQGMCDSVISEDPFSIRYVPDHCKNQQMCYKAVDYCLAALKFVPDCFVTSKMTKILFTAFYTDENILYFHDYSGNFGFTCNGMGILNIDLNNIYLDDTNNDEDDPNTIILVRLLTWYSKSQKHKALKKDK